MPIPTTAVPSSGASEPGLVSIVMPAYNASAFIAGAIESVTNQTYAHWELLIVDDASTDETAAIAARYAAGDARIRLLTNDRAKGVVGARNTAIEQARGEFIAFLDTDDRWTPDKLVHQVEFMRQTGCAFSCTSYRMVDENDTPLNDVRVPPVLSYERLLRGNSIGCLTAMYSQRLLGKIHMPDGYHHEDYLTWLNITRRAGPARGLDIPLGIYRKHRGSLSGSKVRAAQWQWRIYRHALKLSVVHSAYLFCHYAVQGLRKHRKG